MVAILGIAWVIGGVGGPHLADLIDRVNVSGRVSPVLFVGLYALATVLLLPGSVLTLAAGALYGPVTGTVVAMAGATAGAAAAFMIARYLLRPLILRRMEGDARFHAVDRAVSRGGTRVVLLLRLSPVLPFNILNYALGASAVRPAAYLAGSIGMLPGAILYVLAGWGAGEVATVAAGGGEPRGPWAWVLLCVGLVATGVAVTHVARAARRELASTDSPGLPGEDGLAAADEEGVQ